MRQSRIDRKIKGVEIDVYSLARSEMFYTATSIVQTSDPTQLKE